MSSRQRLEDRFGDLYIKEDKPPTGAFKNGLPTYKPVIYRNPEDSDSDDEYPLPPPPPHLSSRGAQDESSYYQPYMSSSQSLQHPPAAYTQNHQTTQSSYSDDFLPAPTPLYATYTKDSSSMSSDSYPKHSGAVTSNYHPMYSHPSNYVHSREASHSSQLSAEIDHLYESIKARPNSQQPTPATPHSMPQAFTPYRAKLQAHPHNTAAYSSQGALPTRSSSDDTYEIMQVQKADGASGLVPLPSDQPVSKPVKTGKEAEVDALTNLLLQNMEASADPDFFGMCGKCGQSIIGENSGCTALDQVYHIQCFTCVTCDLCLKGTPFFAMEGKPYCENCYMNTLEKCSVCSKPITDRILRATGKPYHPGCFTCVVCGKSLDGVPFTVDATNQIHCIEDFHKKFAPRCCVCARPIMPEPGREETIRIVALDRSFHVHCYKCEDCGLLLSSEADGRGCYPLDDHILCKNCNAMRIQALTTKMTTEL